MGNQALLAIEKATPQKIVPIKESNLAREASIMLMMAHDRFSASGLCLHYLFSSPNLAELELSSAISRLDGSEVLGLVRYLEKWLEKYQRFREVVSCCPSVGSVLGLRVCECVPSLESVVRELGMMLDEHFSYFVLNSNSHEEVKTLGNVVGSLSKTCVVLSLMALQTYNQNYSVEVHRQVNWYKQMLYDCS